MFGLTRVKPHCALPLHLLSSQFGNLLKTWVQKPLKPEIFKTWIDSNVCKVSSTSYFSGFRDFRTHVSSRLPDCENRRANGTVQWAFTLVNPNISSYWSSILCPGIFQKNYARLILVIYLVMLIYLLLKKSLLIFFWMVSIKLVIHLILRKIKQGKREDISL